MTAGRRIASGSAYEDRIGYARAVVDADGWVFVSGCTGTDPATMTLPPRVEDQCAAALATLAAALREAGATFADVRRVRYILPDRADFAPCWPLLRAAFAEAPRRRRCSSPASSTRRCGSRSRRRRG